MRKRAWLFPVSTAPRTSQYSGFGAAAGTSVAEVTVSRSIRRALMAAASQPVIAADAAPTVDRATASVAEATSRVRSGARRGCRAVGVTRAALTIVFIDTPS